MLSIHAARALSEDIQYKKRQFWSATHAINIQDIRRNPARTHDASLIRTLDTRVEAGVLTMKNELSITLQAFLNARCLSTAIVVRHNAVNPMDRHDWSRRCYSSVLSVPEGLAKSHLAPWDMLRGSRNLLPNTRFALKGFLLGCWRTLVQSARRRFSPRMDRRRIIIATVRGGGRSTLPRVGSSRQLTQGTKAATGIVN